MRKSKRRPSLETPDLLDLADRATRLDNGEILDALDITISNIGRYASEFRHSRNTDFLAEMSMAAQAVYVMVEEMATRAGQRASKEPVRRSVRSYE